MIDRETQFTKDFVQALIIMYQHEKNIELKMLLPQQSDSINYRIKIYNRKYKRTTIAINFEEFLDIITMYNELEKYN